MPRHLEEVETLLQNLEAALRDVGLWSVTAPDEKAMKSQAPFACDSMPFEQWLQYIFIPRLRIMTRLRQTLPNRMGLFPMGQQCFTLPLHQSRMLPVLQQIDLFFKE